MLFRCTKFTLIVLALSLAVSALGNYIFPSKFLFGLIIFLGIISFIVKSNKAILTVILLFVSTVYTEIKTRKQKGEKLNAYSKEGAAATRRKARALGIEECFVVFLGEEEVRERRGR